MGGMQALQWTVQAPGRVGKAFVTASTGAHSAMQIGFNEVGRQAIMRDPRSGAAATIRPTIRRTTASPSLGCWAT